MVKEDMAEVEVTEEDTVDRNNWRRKIRCGDPESRRRTMLPISRMLVKNVFCHEKVGYTL